MRSNIHTFRYIVSQFILISLALLICGATAVTAQTQSTVKKSGADQITDIVRDPADVPASPGHRPAKVVRVTLVTKEVIGNLDPAAATTYRYWTFNGKVPGPMIRVRQGDTVEVLLHNDAASHMMHSVDFHAAIGPGGGAALSQVLPGQSKTFTFQATTAGLFVYHCGTPMIADHIANGMYGLILVEPPEGLARVDHEYYIMQGEIYSAAPKGKSGEQIFSETRLMSEAPQYYVFNGAVDALTKQYPLKAGVAETVRIFFGNAGPNGTSSLHVVGEIFARDYALGSLTSPPLNDVQTASVPPGSAVVLEIKAAMPGKFVFMDHAMSRMAKGLTGVLDVTGHETARLMYPGEAPASEAPPALAITNQDAESAEALLKNNSLPKLRSLPDSGVHPTKIKNKIEQQHGTSASPSATSTDLNGCLTWDGQMPKLTLFHSHKFYRLEPRAMLMSEKPLLFANNINSLVHVTGRMTHLADTYDADHAGVFEVDTMNQLATTCNVTESLAQLRQGQQKGSEESRVASVHGTLTNQVHMGDMAFVPATIEVEVGQRVVWHNTSITVHNVVDDGTKALTKTDVKLPSSAKPFDSGYLQPGQSFARAFNEPGIYHYVCTLHEASGMKGVIVVRPRTPGTYIANAHAGSALPDK